MPGAERAKESNVASRNSACPVVGGVITVSIPYTIVHRASCAVQWWSLEQTTLGLAEIINVSPKLQLRPSAAARIDVYHMIVYSHRSEEES